MYLVILLKYINVCREEWTTAPNINSASLSHLRLNLVTVPTDPGSMVVQLQTPFELQIEKKENNFHLITLHPSMIKTCITSPPQVIQVP